jgi:hypothetical protein
LQKNLFKQLLKSWKWLIKLIKNKQIFNWNLPLILNKCGVGLHNIITLKKKNSFYYVNYLIFDIIDVYLNLELYYNEKLF